MSMQAESYIRLLYNVPESWRTLRMEGRYTLVVQEEDGWVQSLSVSPEMVEQPIIPDYPQSTWQRFHDASWADNHSDEYLSVLGDYTRR